MKRVLLTLLIATSLTGAVAIAAPALSSAPYAPTPVEFELGPTGAAAGQAVAGDVVSRPLDTPKRFDLVGLRWSAGNAKADVDLRVRREGGPWSDWAEATPDPDHAPDPGRGEPAHKRISAPVWAGGADEVQYRTSERLRGVKLEFINTTGTATAADRAKTAVRKAASRGVAGVARVFAAHGAAARPSMVTRSSWDPNNSCRPRSSPATGSVKVVFVHHTVTANGYSSSDGPSMVRGICQYHRNTNGWDDIGYNFLVDKYGRLYEGRAGGVDRAIVGAQAQGWNAQSTGVANLGDFTNREQSSAALSAMDRLINWKLDIHRMPRGGKSTLVSAGGGTNRYRAGTRVEFNRISGHRNGNLTECPGNRLYEQLPRLRRAVEDDSGSDRPTTPFQQVVDNADLSRFSASGNWSTSTRATAAKQGANFRYAAPAPTSDPARFRLRAPSAGRYAIYIWHPAHADYSSSAPVGVDTRAGVKWTRLDMRTGGGRWVPLGEYSLAAGEEPNVLVSRWTSARGWLVADAVRMVGG